MKELCFRSLLPADLAYAPLNAVQIQFLEIAGRDLFYDPSPIEGVVPLGLHFLVGYPNSRNKVHMPRALANLGNSGHCITLPIGTPIDLNHVDKSRALMHFKFDNRELHLSSSLGAAQFSKFSGLSGSPVSELTCGKSLSGGITFGARLVGVLTEFSQQTKIITVEPISSLLCPA